MSEKDTNRFDPLMDTQRLLNGVEVSGTADFTLEDILAEYGGKPAAAPSAPAEKPPVLTEKPPVPAEKPAPPPEHKVLPFPGTSPRDVAEPESPVQRDAAAPEHDAGWLRPDNEIDDISPEDLFGLGAAQAAPETESVPAERAPEAQQAAEEEPTVSMEDIVASTVDAVKEDQERRQEKFRKKLEKQRKRTAPPVKRREPAARHPLPEVDSEPPMNETASRHKRRYYGCRRSLLLALPILLLLWAPWVLTQAGIAVPFFCDSGGNADLCVLIPQALICVLGWPVFRAAQEGLWDGGCTVYLLAAAANVVTLLDEMTLLFLPGRTAAAPVGGVAAMAMLFSLWGLTSYHKGMWETFKVASLGQPTYVVDCCDAGIAKGRGGLSGFHTRANMEDTSAQWQRLLTPVLLIGSVVFAALSSFGQGRGQDFLLVWSVILCAGSALVFPLVFCVPFGRLATRLGRSGAAVAGQYGAASLASMRRIVVTDGDLFPQGTVALNGLKLYGEERNQAISYAATLAVQGGGCLGRVFEDICRGERISFQPLEHFHMHDDGGLSGMVHGETVLLGPPIFMRHQAVRLPASLPAKTTVCLAVDGELTAVFSVKYNTSDLVESALRALGRNGLQLTLAVRDGNITPKLLKTRFGTDGGAVLPELSERLNLSDGERDGGGPNGILYREGLYPFVDAVAGSRRLCHVIHIGNLLSVLGSVAGVLLGFYMTFTASYAVLTPLLLATYLLLWVLPMLPLLWGVDKT